MMIGVSYEARNIKIKNNEHNAMGEGNDSEKKGGAVGKLT